MFGGFERDLKKKLIALYEDFIEDSQEKNLEGNAAAITQKYANSGSHISKISKKALLKAYDLELGNLSKDEAKKILEELRKTK